MFLNLILFLILGCAGLLFVPAARRRIVETLKSFSDALLLKLLRATSGFGRELTKDGAAEQQMHREQRLRNLRGLALREKEKISAHTQDEKPTSPDGERRS